MPYKVATGRTLFAQKNYQAKVLDMFGSSIVAFWPQNESGGTVSRDIGGRGLSGSYTGVTLRAQGIGDGETAASYDGTTSNNNIYSAGLASAFNNQELTLLAWARVGSVGVWTDGIVRYVSRVAADVANDVLIVRDIPNNQLTLAYRAGGVSKGISLTALGGSLNLFCAALTVSKSLDAVTGYINGIKTGSTQTSLGTWSGALNSGRCAIGASVPGPSNVWSGSIGPVLLLNRAATAGEIAAASAL